MSRLIDEIGDLWAITLDLVGFYHECCYNCQPREDGDYVWLSERYDLGDVLQDILTGVCEVNGHELSIEPEWDVFEEALNEQPFVCPNCGTEHTEPGNEIGGEWLVARGHKTDSATYLLTRSYWPYLTHYTKVDERYSDGLQRLLAIVDEGVIRGTLNMLEGNTPAVCFTECSPLEILQMLHVMRLDPDELPYRQRGFEWTRSRHGIAIKRDTLIENGAYPVIYGDETIKARLGQDELWRFKLFAPTLLKNDWTFEREFRVPRNINLADIENPSDIILIVENTVEQFNLLARRDVPIYAIMPFDFVYSSDSPYPHRSERQKWKGAERYL